MSEPKPRSRRPKPAPATVFVRGRSSNEARGLRELPPDFEALAKGNKPTRQRPKETLRDDRAEALIPGVANRDARAVCDARVERMIGARDGGDREGLGRELAEAFRLGLWRGANLIGFDALLQDVLGLRLAEGRALAQEGAEHLGCSLVRASDRVVATWFRAEAGLLASDSACRVELQGHDETERFVITIPAERADLWIAEMGKRVVPLSKFLPAPAPPRTPASRRPTR